MDHCMRFTIEEKIDCDKQLKNKKKQNLPILTKV